MGQDVAGLVATVDEQAEQIDQAAQAVAKIQADHLEDLEKVKADQETAAAHAAKLANELEQVRAELAKGRADAVHAAELADSGRAMMRAELDRLTDQVGELKAHLYKRADSAPAV